MDDYPPEFDQVFKEAAREATRAAAVLDPTEAIERGTKRRRIARLRKQTTVAFVAVLVIAAIVVPLPQLHLLHSRMTPPATGGRHAIRPTPPMSAKVLGWGFDEPDAVAADGTHVWVANASGDSVTELSESTGALVKVLSARSYGFDVPDAIAADGTHVWVADSNGHSVTELSQSTGALVKVLRGIHGPDGIAVDGTHVWVADYGCLLYTSRCV